MEELPEHWSDLTDEEKRALLDMVKGRLFWTAFWERAGWLKQAGLILLTLGAAFTLFRDWIVGWITG